MKLNPKKPIILDIQNNEAVVIFNKEMIGKNISFQDIPKTKKFLEWMRMQ